MEPTSSGFVEAAQNVPPENSCCRDAVLHCTVCAQWFDPHRARHVFQRCFQKKQRAAVCRLQTVDQCFYSAESPFVTKSPPVFPGFISSPRNHRRKSSLLVFVGLKGLML